ncbi:hypothetical protein L6452_42261 [Arctium lappa]|uniref:Uncharacterized protein n=1 Tax=Arctium lappa TaxID=4217 RepID=A0ACB8XHZ6_ARCLA|nr:hypothetical protein L6452_42261 [Arctium lappa]
MHPLSPSPFFCLDLLWHFLPTPEMKPFIIETLKKSDIVLLRSSVDAIPLALENVFSVFLRENVFRALMKPSLMSSAESVPLMCTSEAALNAKHSLLHKALLFFRVLAPPSSYFSSSNHRSFDVLQESRDEKMSFGMAIMSSLLAFFASSCRALSCSVHSFMGLGCWYSRYFWSVCSSRNTRNSDHWDVRRIMKKRNQSRIHTFKKVYHPDFPLRIFIPK